MDPTSEEKQNNQNQEKQSGGGLNHGINTINNLVGLKNPFGKIGSRVATQTVLKGFSAFLASPVGLPILITIAAVFIFTIIIMGFGGVPFSEPAQTQIPTPTLAP